MNFAGATAIEGHQTAIAITASLSTMIPSQYYLGGMGSTHGWLVYRLLVGITLKSVFVVLWSCCCGAFRLLLQWLSRIWFRCWSSIQDNWNLTWAGCQRVETCLCWMQAGPGQIPGQPKAQPLRSLVFSVNMQDHWSYSTRQPVGNPINR